MTIHQFIFGFELIDPIRLQVDNAQTLEVYQLKENQKDLLTQTYKFNKFGKVASCEKIHYKNGGWTAYPPLGLEDPKKDGKADESKIEKVIDKYIYSPLGNLTKIESHNLDTDNIISVKTIAYDNNKIVSINGDKKKTTISRNSNDQITSIKYEISILANFPQTINFKFVWKESQVIEKIWDMGFKEKNSFSAKTSLNYDNFGKLQSTEIYFEDEQEKHHAETKLELLSKESNLIRSIVSYENKELNGTTTFEYDSFDRLVKTTAQEKNLNKNVPVVTKYVWS